MNKPLLVFASVLAGLFTAPVSSQVTKVTSVEAQEAVREYDSCLVKAMMRAERAGTPLELQHGASMRSCRNVRSSLLVSADEGSEVAAALDAVDRIRQKFADDSGGEAENELANLRDIYLMERLAWRIDRETFSPRTDRVTPPIPVRSQTPPQS